MPDESHYRRLERMYQTARTNEYYRPSLTVSDGATELVIPIRPEFHHAAGAAHGCVYFKALDDSAFFSVASLVDDVFVLTASFTIYLTRPIKDGDMIARGRVVHRTRRTFIAESEAVDARGRLLAKGSGTFMRSEIPLGPDVGYA